MPLQSPASSVTNLDLNEGILVHDLDPDVTAVGYIHDVASDESRRNLRDHLRRTLSVQRTSQSETLMITAVSADTTLQGYSPQEYFVLTDAGIRESPRWQGSRESIVRYGRSPGTFVSLSRGWRQAPLHKYSEVTDNLFVSLPLVLCLCFIMGHSDKKDFISSVYIYKY